MASSPQGQQLLSLQGVRTTKEAFRDVRNYLAGQFVGATRDEALLEEVIKCLFCKLFMETGSAEAVDLTSDAFTIAATVRTTFAMVRAAFPEAFDPTTELLLDPESIAVVLRACAFPLIGAANDPIGDAFEVFVGSESRGRSGQFFTPRIATDLLVAAVDPQPHESVIDPACGAGGFLTAVARHYLASGLSSTKLPSLTAKNLYGVDKDEYLVRLARVHVALLTGGHPKIQCADSLALQAEPADLQYPFPKQGFDVVLTNPPFGARIIAARPEVLRSYALAKKWQRGKGSERWEPTTEVQLQVPPQVLFIERCLGLLRPGGRMGIVLPESLLSNKSYAHVREYLLQRCEVEAVIGMPDALFKTSGKGGTHTKTCLLVATKQGKGSSSNARVFMAEARWCGHDSRARVIPKNDLPQIAANLAAFRAGVVEPHSTLGFVVDRSQMDASILCPRYYDPQLEEELRGLEKTHHLYRFGDLVRDGVLSMDTGDELGKLAYGTGEIPFVRTSDLSSWEIKADAKHGIDRKLYETHRQNQDVRPGDILMVKDGTYLVGTCAIVTEQDVEMIYQSHLYKIRVENNELGIDAALLLAVLSCPLVQRQVRSKQFTQDIIDSLGGRIDELVLPIHKNAMKRREVSDQVKQAIDFRSKARQLTARAKAAVV